MSSQTLRKPSTTTDETLQVEKPEQQSQAGGSPTFCGSLLQADETASWFHYSIDENQEEFPFFCDIPSVEPAKESPSSQSKTILKQYNNLSLEEGYASPAKLQDEDAPVAAGANLSSGRLPNFFFFSAEKTGFRGGGNGVHEGREPSMVTVGSSHRGRNQVQNEGNYSRVSGMFARPAAVDAHKQNDKKNNNDTMETTLTSSSGGSGGSLARTSKQADSSHSHKRKGRGADEYESHSEEAEYESVEASKPASKTASARRSRAAEVHNLSERRRRDRINEKMRALQELIPHCNKTDKASMLDEAIEYLKSLQLQVQIMWMGNGMTPIMYPGIQPYIPRMVMAMNPTALAPLHGHLRMPRVPIVDLSVSTSGAPNPSMGQPQLLNPMNFQQMHGANLPEAYARYLGFHSMPMGQAVNLFPYGSQTVQANQSSAAPSSNGGPCNVGVSSKNPQNGNLG